MDKIVVIDCQAAGVAGDMLLAALVDLGFKEKRLAEVVETVARNMPGCRKAEVVVKDVVRHGFRAKKVDIVAEEEGEASGEALIRVVSRSSEELGLSEKARRIATKAIRTLVKAEARMHGGGHIHLHEAGSVDTPAEIVGVVAALEQLGLLEARIFSTPVAVGGGLIKFSHGVVPSPAPATLEILRTGGFPLVGGPVEAELATPTGAAILVSIAEKAATFYPPMRPEAVGFGAGSREFSELANVLRIVVGTPPGYGFLRDNVVVLETNLDDVSGEVVGYALERLMEEGARDASMVPIFAKKGRPGYLLRVLADPGDADRLARLMIEETGSLGVRMYMCERRILAREIIPVRVRIGGIEAEVRVKVSRDSMGRILQVKPEYEDVKRLALQAGKPFGEAWRLALAEALKRLT